MLKQGDYIRYSRQLLLESFGAEAQEKLRDTRVTIARIGGLGGSSSLLLAAAGVGQITIIEDGFIELSNLNRQILYQHCDLGKPKVIIAQRTLSQLNPEIEITPVPKKITDCNVSNLIRGTGVPVDGMDIPRLGLF